MAAADCSMDALHALIALSSAMEDRSALKPFRLLHGFRA